MDKNTLTGLLLMALVIFGFMWLNKPSEEEIAAQRARQEQIAAQTSDDSQSKPDTEIIISKDEIARIVPTVKTFGDPVPGQPGSFHLKTQVLDLVADSASNITGSVTAEGVTTDVNDIMVENFGDMLPEKASAIQRALCKAISDINKYKSFARYLDGENERITLQNDVMRVTFATKGGIIEEVELKKYMTETTATPTNVKLFTADNGGYSFTLTTNEQVINTADLNFVPGFDVSQEGDTAMVMRLPLSDTSEWGIRYTLVPGEYIIKTELFQKGMDQIMPTNLTSIDFDWHQKMSRNEKGRTFEERNSAIYYKLVVSSPDDLNANGDDSKSVTGDIKWIAFKNQFFSSVIIARESFNSADMNSIGIKSDRFLKDMSVHSNVPYSVNEPVPVAFDFYFGPNDYPLLSSLDEKLSPDEDLELTRLVPLGWGLFRWVNKFIIIPVFSFLGSFISNYGIIILLLTLFIKLILFPFTYKSYISQAKMRVLSPEIKEINDKYPGNENAMKRQQETMALYSKAGASPFSGCLPLLLQMPVLIAMFAFFPSAIELRGQSFLWVHDLSAPDAIFTLPFTIPFYGNHVSLFCLLMTVTNIIYTRINMQNQPGGSSMPGMKWMMYLMPVMFLFFFNDYAAGLSYYYFLSLLITIVQTYIFRHVIDEKKVRAQMLENAKKPRKKKGMMARLEEAQRRQQALMREQAKQQSKRKK